MAAKKKESAALATPKPRTPCHRCDTTGQLSYALQVNGSARRYAFRCSCPAGDWLSKSIPRFDDAFPESAGADQGGLDIASAHLDGFSR